MAPGRALKLEQVPISLLIFLFVQLFAGISWTIREFNDEQAFRVNMADRVNRLEKNEENVRVAWEKNQRDQDVRVDRIDVEGTRKLGLVEERINGMSRRQDVQAQIIESIIQSLRASGIQIERRP